MINNIQDIFLKYKNTIQTKKNVTENFLIYFKNNFELDINENNLKIDFKNKKIKILNLSSTFKFVLKNKSLNEKTTEFIFNSVVYKIDIN